MSEEAAEYKRLQNQPIPNEVLLVWAHRGKAVGYSKYKELQVIIEQHPTYFPWEAKYRSIPDSVHDAYKREAFPYLYEDKPLEYRDGLSSSGLYEQLKQKATPIEPLTEQTLQQAIDLLLTYDQRRLEARKIQLEKEQALWDKHYAPYGLAFRDDSF